MDEEDRKKRNLQEVLRLAVTNTPHNPDLTPQPRTVPMDPQRQEFLKNVLSDFSSTAVTKMRHLLESLDTKYEEVTKLYRNKDGDDELYAAMLSDLDELTEITSQIDQANDFVNLDGFSIIARLLQISHEGILCNTAVLIAELVQNNPVCQNVAINLHFMSILLSLMDKHPKNYVKIKSLYALSCLMRDHKDGLHIFENSDGFSIFLRAMQSDVLKLRIKVSFLLTSLCNQRPDYRDILCNMGFVEQIIALLRLEHDESHEHLLGLLLQLASHHEPSVKECTREELGLKELLQGNLEREMSLKEDERNDEEYDYCLKLLDICFKIPTTETPTTENELER